MPAAAGALAVCVAAVAALLLLVLPPLPLRGVALVGLVGIAAAAVCAFATAHGVSMIVGRRRPRLHAPLRAAVPERVPAGLSMRLRTVAHWDAGNHHHNKHGTHGSTTQQPTDEDWGPYARRTPTRVGPQWCLLLRAWSLIFRGVLRLPLRRLWDAGGLEEALLQCPGEVFELPALSAGSAARNAHAGLAAAQPPTVRRLVSSGRTAAGRPHRRMYVGYRGLVFDEERVFVDRATARTVLHELMSWRDDLCFVGHHEARLACASPASFAFPTGVQRAGRHPRMQQARPEQEHGHPARLSSSSSASSVSTSRVVRHVPGTLISVLQLHNGYYHWVTERLPALCLVLPVLRDDPTARVLVDFGFHGAPDDSPWCAQFLRILGIPLDRVVKYDPCVVYSCDALCVTSPVPAYAAHRGLLQRARRTTMASPSVAAALREAETTAAAPTVRGVVRRAVLIHRAGSKVRRTAVWPRVKRALEAQASDNAMQVEILDLARMPVLDQIVAFARADLVVGVHGAGLANMLWCKPGTHVVEIVPINPPPIRHLFWHLASSGGGLVYSPFFCASAWNDPLCDVDAGRFCRWLLKTISPQARVSDDS